MSSPPLLEARGIEKSFGHVQALQDVDFAVHEGEVVALMGDNGAGKSTFVKILSGVIAPDRGELFVRGRPATFASPQEAREAGVETVYQDLALADTLDPAANLFLGREIRRRGWLGRLGFVDDREMRARAADVFARLNVPVRAEHDAAGRLSGGQRQGIAVSRAVNWASKVLFLDEPTAALGVQQTRNVLDLIRRVREAGVSVVLISHSLPEVRAVADRIEVLRLGRRVASFKAGAVSAEEIVASITGASDHEREAA